MKAQDVEARIKKEFPKASVYVLDITETGRRHFEVREAPKRQPARIFEVKVSSDESLKKLSRLQQHQSILNLFKEELRNGTIHAFSIKVV